MVDGSKAHLNPVKRRLLMDEDGTRKSARLGAGDEGLGSGRKTAAALPLHGKKGSGKKGCKATAKAATAKAVTPALSDKTTTPASLLSGKTTTSGSPPLTAVERAVIDGEINTLLSELASWHGGEKPPPWKTHHAMLEVACLLCNNTPGEKPMEIWEVALPANYTTISAWDLTRNASLPIFRITDGHLNMGALTALVKKRYLELRRKKGGFGPPWETLQDVWSRILRFYHLYWVLHKHIEDKRAVYEAAFAVTKAFTSDKSFVNYIHNLHTA